MVLYVCQGKRPSPPTKRSLKMAEFVLVETYVEHSYHDNYLMGVYFDGWNTRHESLGYGNGILNGGYADAQSEVIERYRRVKSLRRRLEKRAFYKEAAEKMGLRSYHEARELARACTNEEFEKIVRLLSTKKFRSSFRQSLASQVRAWVDGKSEFATPLSPRQFAALY